MASTVQGKIHANMDGYLALDQNFSSVGDCPSLLDVPLVQLVAGEVGLVGCDPQGVTTFSVTRGKWALGCVV